MSSFKSLIVKQVLSGDTLVLRDRSKSGPPPERVIAINNIIAPRLARRPTNENNEMSIDEPFAWEAREFIRQLCIGQEVLYQVENKSPGGREYANVFITNSAGDKDNLAELIVGAGFAEVRRQTNVGSSLSEHYQKLLSLEDAARASHKGKWAGGDLSKVIRNVVWNVDNLAAYVDSYQNKQVPAIIEHVRDGCTVRGFILPNDIDCENNYKHVTIMLSGIKTPGFKIDNNEQVPEPFADEAKFFVESKLLQRKVEIRLETVNNQNIVGTVLHPKGNIAELALKEGFGRIVDWSMGVLLPNVAAAYRLAERQAKEKRLRVWKDYEPPKDITELPAVNGKDKPYELTSNRTLTGKVIEVGNGDNVTIKCTDGHIRKIFLSSIRSPKLSQAEPTTGSNKRFRPIYDIPYMFEAREFLRKKLIGKKVSVRVDYIQPKTENLEERVMGTISVGDMNVAEAIVMKGLATVVRYRPSDENRSLYYDSLLAAESVAQKKSIGVFSKKEAPTHRVSDLSGDSAKAKQFFSSLKRQGRMSGVVEFVASGSRLRVYVPKETCILTILCAGIECPRPQRRLPNGKEEPADEFGSDALEFTKDMCNQREVELEIDNMDKAGNFIGWVYLESSEGVINSNLSVLLVDAGLARVHFTAERSTHYKQLCEAETKAKEQKLNIWTVEGQLSYIENTAKQVAAVNLSKGDEQQSDRSFNYKNVIVTQVTSGTRFYGQFVDNESIIVGITKELQTHFAANPHVPGAYSPKKGDLCAAKFSLDGCWYRAKVLKVDSSRSVRLLYVDFGNEEVTDSFSLASLPSSLSKIQFQATEYSIACLMCPPNDDDAQEMSKFSLETDLLDKEVRINIEYEDSVDNIRAVSVLVKQNDAWNDEAEILLREGILFVDEKRKDKKLSGLIKTYLTAQDEARSKRLNIWKYGDFRSDDGPL